MTTYVPTVIGAGPFDGSVVDDNFDKFQTATGALTGTNFANTDDLGFRNMHPGSVTETFVENGNPVVAIYNAFSALDSNLARQPYPSGKRSPFVNVVHDTEVSFVAKADGEVFVVSSAALSRPKCHWIVTATNRTYFNVYAYLRMAEGLNQGTAASTGIIGAANYTWTFGQESSERVGQDLRACGHQTITSGERYSFWLELSISASTVLPTGVIAMDPWPIGSATNPTYFPEGAPAVSIYGSSRQTVATCIYK